MFSPIQGQHHIDLTRKLHPGHEAAQVFGDVRNGCHRSASRRRV